MSLSQALQSSTIRKYRNYRKALCQSF